MFEPCHLHNSMHYYYFNKASKDSDQTVHEPKPLFFVIVVLMKKVSRAQSFLPLFIYVLSPLSMMIESSDAQPNLNHAGMAHTIYML